MKPPTLSIALGLALASVAFPAAAPRAQMGAGAPPDTARAGIRYIYMVRHGWYDEADPRDARIGKGLDSLGRAQASLAGQRLAGLPIHVSSLVSSTFTRAMQTADIIGGSLHMAAVRDSELSECSPPSVRADTAGAPDRAERAECEARLEHAWARYVRPAGGPADVHDVLVCHGNVIRWFVSKALSLDTKRWTSYDIGNASITAIEVRPDGTTRLAAYSDTGHLPPALQTWTGRGAGWSPPAPPVPRGRRGS